MKNIVIGAVNSTRNLVETMLRLEMDVSMVFCLDATVAENVSAYCPLHEYAEKMGIPYKKFKKINDKENIELMQQIEPDYIFAIGFSQLVSKKILDIPKECVIGCHPAPLPKYRGRAVVVWQMLNEEPSTKITMFKIDEGADSGDIIDQEPVTLYPYEYVGDLLERMDNLQIRLFERVLLSLKNGTAKFTKQNEDEATYALRRSPEDGWIDWNIPGKDIVKLIRATSHPYPGAYGMYDRAHKIILWRARFEDNHKYIGFNGQIAKVGENEIEIVVKDGLIVVTEFENVDSVKMFSGHRLI